MSLRVAVDVCVGRKGCKVLRDHGHTVVVVAEPAEPDVEWFRRARALKVDVVIAVDRDLEILCWDHNVMFHHARCTDSGKQTALRFVSKAWRYERALGKAAEAQHRER